MSKDERGIRSMNRLTDNNALAAIEIDEVRAQKWAQSHYCAVCFTPPKIISQRPQSRMVKMHCDTCNVPIIESGGYITSYQLEKMEEKEWVVKTEIRTREPAKDFDEEQALKLLGFN